MDIKIKVQRFAVLVSSIEIINEMHPLFFMADVWFLTTGKETQPGIREVIGNKSPNTSNCTSRLYLRRNLIA